MMVRRKVLIVLPVLASMLLVGCKDSLLDRSLIFSTHTTLGVEASVAPAESGEPISLIIGYKRSEGVINPVYHSEGIETADEEQTAISSKGQGQTKTSAAKGRRPRYRTDAYSVIAKFSGDAGTSATGAAEGKISVAQWFATGKAAKILANQPAIAGAVSGSSEVARAASDAFMYQALTLEQREKITLDQVTREQLANEILDKLQKQDGSYDLERLKPLIGDDGSLIEGKFTNSEIDALKTRPRPLIRSPLTDRLDTDELKKLRDAL
jgi:hypothetical protein